MENKKNVLYYCFRKTFLVISAGVASYSAGMLLSDLQAGPGFSRFFSSLIFMAVVFFFLRHQLNPDVFQLKKIKFFAFYLVLFLTLNLVVNHYVLGNLPVRETVFKSKNVFVVLTSAFFVAFSEEIVFRGMILGKLMHFFKPYQAVLISSLFFVCGHLFVNPFHIFGGGLICGFAYLYGKNIWTPVIIHFVNNFLASAAVF